MVHDVREVLRPAQPRAPLSPDVSIRYAPKTACLVSLFSCRDNRLGRAHTGGVSQVHNNSDATAGVLVRTFWTLGDFRCVLVREDGRMSLQVFINERPFLTERSKDTAEAMEQADALFVVFSGAHSTLQRS